MQNCPTCGGPQPNADWDWSKIDAALCASAPDLLTALRDTVGRLEMIASDMRGGLLGHGIGLADYEAGVRRCHQRAAAVLANAEGRQGQCQPTAE